MDDGIAVMDANREVQMCIPGLANKLMNTY